MSTSTLVAHSPKFAAKLTTLDALRALPAPMALGPMHKPVAHATLVEAIAQEVANRGMRIVKQELALSAKGQALFGVIDLVPGQGYLVHPTDDRGVSFGFRNSTDQSMGIRGVAGARVFVCDNMALSGSMFAINRKNTTGLDLGHAIASGFDRFIEQAEILNIQIERLQEIYLTDSAAKTLIYEVFQAQIIPVRLFDDVDRFYFRPTEATPDCQPRTQWGLHNAFTRAMKDLSPVRGFNANVALGQFFGMSGKV